MKFHSDGDIETELTERYYTSHYEVWLKGHTGFLAEDNLYGTDLAEKFIITKDDIVLEIGTYNGLGTARLCELAKHVIAVEADKRNYELMVLNTKGLNVTPINKAVSDKKGILVFYEGKHPQAKSLNKELLNIESEYEIETDCIDNFVFEATYVTLEINMGELKALEGMPNLLKNYHPRIILRGHNSENVKNIKSFLERFGYKIHIGKRKRIYAW